VNSVIRVEPHRDGPLPVPEGMGLDDMIRMQNRMLAGRLLGLGYIAFAESDHVRVEFDNPAEESIFWMRVGGLSITEHI
jgi:hypothetical protein